MTSQAGVTIRCHGWCLLHNKYESMYFFLWLFLMFTKRNEINIAIIKDKGNYF